MVIFEFSRQKWSYFTSNFWRQNSNILARSARNVVKWDFLWIFKQCDYRFWICSGDEYLMCQLSLRRCIIMSQAMTSTFHEPFLRIWNLELWIPFEPELLELCSVRITTSMGNPEPVTTGPKDTTLKVFCQFFTIQKYILVHI